MNRFVLGCVAMAAPCAAASGELFFSFDDPGAEREVFIHETGNTLEVLYSTKSTISLSVTSNAGELPDTTFAETRLSMNFTTSEFPPTILGEDTVSFDLYGEFLFEDVSGDDPSVILSGQFDEALAILIIVNEYPYLMGSGSLVGHSGLGSVSLTAGEALLDLLGEGAVLGGHQDSAFALSHLLGPTDDSGSPLLLEGSAAYTGSSEVIPAPGGAALLGLSGLVAMRRRH